MDGCAAGIAGVDLHSSVDPASRCAADQQWDDEPFPLHLRRDMGHFVQRWGDQTGEADDIDLLLARRLQNPSRWHHDAEVDHLIVVAAEHDTDDVLADVVHVAFDRRHQDPAGAVTRFRAHALCTSYLLRLHIGKQIGDRLFHHPRRLYDLWQEHLAGAEKITDDVHASHQRALDDMQRPLGHEPGLLDVGFDEVADAIDQSMLQSFVDRTLAPGKVLRLGLATRHAPKLLGQSQKAFRRINAPVQHNILAGLAQFRLYRLVDGELAGIDDAHVHPRLDRVIQEHRMHRLAHRLSAAEGEREI